MDQLNETASLEDIKTELIIVEVMLETLEPDDDNYDVQRRNLEDYHARLRRMKDVLTGSHIHIPEPHSSENLFAMPRFNRSSELPSRSHGLGLHSESRKRSNHGFSIPSSKHFRASESPSFSDNYTSASQDSLSEAERTLGFSLSRDRQDYLERIRRQEAQRAQEKNDAEMARQVSSQNQHDTVKPTSYPITQAMLGKDGRFQRAPTMVAESSSAALARVKPEYGRGNTNFGNGTGSSHKSEFNSSHMDTPIVGSANRQPYLDSDSDLEEISATAFSSHKTPFSSLQPAMIDQKYNPYASLQQRSTFNPLTYATPGPSTLSQNGYLRAGDTIYGSPGAWPGSTQAQNSFNPQIPPPSLWSSAQNAMNQVVPTFRPLLDEFRTLTGLISGNAAAATPDYDLDEDLDARGWGHLLNDPAKTREELEALLKNIRPDEDLPPEMRLDTPIAMKCPLMEHQKLGLSWLKAQEEGSNKGGILADDMGLGKTIQALALMVSRPSDDSARRTTLIIAPVSLMRQWEREIKIKLRTRYALSVYVYHGQKKKVTFAKLSSFDVVLTTFGTVAAEFTRKEDWEAKKKANPNYRADPKEKFSLLGDECRWYRVIIDEAQYIKNKGTKSARAVSRLNSTYRLCMTGTPMMNNVTELYSLVHFLRIAPYNVYERFMMTFGQPLKSSDEETRQRAMKTFQALLKAILLRRNKKSEIDGKPILTLPERTTEIKHAIFSEDEQAFYKALETKTQLQVNKYLKAGTFGKNYSNILVLLLRLRQACCHPHLIKDHGVTGDGEVSAEAMEDLAHKLEETTISRIKAAGGAFECPVCYDAVENPTIFFPCGHDVCSECFARMTDPSQAVADGADSVNAKCPECRGKVEPKRVLNYMTFKKIHLPEQYEADTGESLARLVAEDDDGLETESEDDVSEDDSDADSQGDLRDFIVPDNEKEEDEADGEADEASEAEVAKKSKKKRRGKAKGKKKEPIKTLAVLKKEAQSSMKAKKRYLRRLRRDWVSSAKIEKTMEILRTVRDNDIREKTIIFSQFTSLLDLLEVPMDHDGWNFRRYDGSMSAKLRNEAVIDFMEKPEVKVMLVSLKAGNAGLNLTEASQVIILDPFWNPFVEEQAIDRAHRIGQTRPVRVHRVLVENSVEDRIIELQERKRALINEALDEKASQSLSRLGQRELAYLFGISSTLAGE